MSKYSIFFDGASKGNPGKAGSAAVLYRDNVEIASISKYIGPGKQIMKRNTWASFLD